MTVVSLLYSDKKIPLQMKIDGPEGEPLMFPRDCFHVRFGDFETNPYKKAVEQEIKVIRQLLPRYNYYLSIPNFTDLLGNEIEDCSESIKQMICINNYLKKVIIETGAELMFLNVFLGNDYECVDDINVVKINLNQDVDGLKKVYDELYKEDNIVQFVLEDH